MKLLAEDLDPVKAALAMFVTTNTIHQYARRIRTFFGVESNAEAVAKARLWDVI